jgi:hypothetical protein
MSPEQYNPTPEDYKKAEDMMTDKEKMISETREEAFVAGYESAKRGEELNFGPVLAQQSKESPPKVESIESDRALIAELRDALIKEYSKEKYSGFNLDEFEKQVDRYNRDPGTSYFQSIIVAAEKIGELRPAKEDSKELRTAIAAMERRMEQDRGLERIDLPRWKDPHYMKGIESYSTKYVQVKGYEKGLVVRILVPAYKDTTGKVNRGVVLLTS